MTIDADTLDRLRRMARIGLESERELEILKPRFDALRDSIHRQWASTTPDQGALDVELKRLLRAINMLEQLFQRDVAGKKLAEDKLKSEGTD